MCGIHCILNYCPDINYNSNKLSARGPDDFQTYTDSKIYMSFYRLSINGISNGTQPMHYKNYVLMCNGEIYNHAELEKLINYKSITGSDCEIILPLFEKFGVEKTCTLLDGVFAFVIWDNIENKLYIGRDRFGVRPLFYSIHNNQIQISSEIKGMTLTDDMSSTTVNHFPPGHFGAVVSNSELNIQPYYLYTWNENQLLKNGLYSVYQGIRFYLHKSVQKRMMTERPIGCLLSGGLDSSLIAALVRNYLKVDKKLHTFSI